MMRARLAAFTRHGDLPASLSIFAAGLLGVLGIAPTTACGGNTIDDEGRGTGGKDDRGTSNAGGRRGDGGATRGTGGGSVVGGDGGSGADGVGGAGAGAGGTVVGVGGFLPLPDASFPPPPRMPGNTECRNPKRRLGYDGKDTGFVECEGGAAHRVGTTDCGSMLPRATACSVGAPQPGAQCTLDTDCTAQPNGFCNIGQVGCYCDYGCLRDSDCMDGMICLCGTPVGKCIPAECITDADCKGDMLCLTYERFPGCPSTAIACQTPADECLSDSDCGGPTTHMRCDRQVDGHRACTTTSCQVGRPYVVGGEARVAGVRLRTDWSASLAPRLDRLGPAERAELAARWAEIASMEHASIAAFARFALELLSLGAPADLVEHAQRAMADEVNHARDAFALASAFAGRPMGPGPLDVRGSLSASSIVDVVRAAVLEGCIGETVAAVEAAEALSVAEDEAVRGVLSRVAADEATHAELAFRFVKWAIENAEPALMNELTGEVTKVVAAERSSCPHPAASSPWVLSSHGVLSEDARAKIRSSVIDEVVIPCLEAIVASTPRVAESKTPGVSRAT